MEDGKLRTVCKIINKGEVYDYRLFDKKIKLFKSKSFLNEVKYFYTDLINEFSLPNEKLKVFDKNSPYIATKKIGKNNPRAKEIKENNKAKDEWNKRITDAYYFGFSKEILFKIKQSEIIEPLSLNNNPEEFKKIVLIASKTIELSNLPMPDEGGEIIETGYELLSEEDLEKEFEENKELLQKIQ